MKKLVFAICAAMALAGATSAYALTEYRYNFLPAATDDGSPTSDWGGSLFLYAPMSLGGSVTDIDKSDSFLQTSLVPSFFLSQSSGVAIRSVGSPIKVPVPFTWNSATITSMDIIGFQSLTVGGPPYDWEITPTSISISPPDPPTVPMATGLWVADGTITVPGVPDTASTIILAGFGIIGLWGFGTFIRSRQMALARSRCKNSRPLPSRGAARGLRR
jgi:hypothetical protein